MWPVSRRVNRTGSGDDDPTLIDEVAAAYATIGLMTSRFLQPAYAMQLRQSRVPLRYAIGSSPARRQPPGTLRT
jgi:hypothetical protein